MSYQQTRSTQDPGFYPRNFSSDLVLTSVALPLGSSFAVADPEGFAPAWEKKVFSGGMTATIPVTVMASPIPNINERLIIQAQLALVGRSGTFLNAVWAQASMYWASNIAGVGTVNQIPTAPLTAGFNEGAFSAGLVPSLTPVYLGPTLVFVAVVGGVAGTAKYTLSLDITRATF